MEINKIYNEDCFDLLNSLSIKSIDLIITDPPYWHKKSPGKPYSQRKNYNTKSIFSNSNLYKPDGLMMKYMSDFNGDMVYKLLNEFKRIMKKMNAYIFCNDTLIPYYTIWAENNNYMFSILIWEKPLSIINKNRFSQNIEYIVRIYEYGTALNKRKENYLYNKVKKYSINKKVHPTQKPLDLMREILMVSSKENYLVLDPFIGSGTTAIACIKEKCNFIGCEISSEYFKIAKNRIDSELLQYNII